MYVYRQIKQGIWSVGFFAPKAAAKRVHYLNGGAPADDICFLPQGIIKR